MISRQLLTSARYHLAQYYLTKLKQADQATHRGRENSAHWLDVIQKDWEQIKQWQAWSASGAVADTERARLCASFLLAGMNILRLRQNLQETHIWLQQALEAAHRIGDVELVLTLLYHAGTLSLTLEEPDAGEQHALELLERGRAVQSELAQGRAWQILGVASFVRGEYDRSDACFQTSLALLEACNAVDDHFKIWQSLARLQQMRGNYQQANTYFMRYLDAATAMGSEQSIMDAHTSLSGISLALREYEKAEAHAQEAVTMAGVYGITRLLPPAMLSLAHAQKWLGKYDSACEYYEQAIAIARTVSVPSTLINGLYGLGQARFLQENYKGALLHLDEALGIARDAQLPLRFCEVAHDIVFAHVMCDELDAAQLRLQEALASAIRLGTPHFLAKSLAAAIIVWHQRGMVDRAAEWARLLAQYRHNLHPSLYTTGVFDQFLSRLRTDSGRGKGQSGETQSLEDTVSEILASIS